MLSQPFYHLCEKPITRSVIDRRSNTQSLSPTSISPLCWLLTSYDDDSKFCESIVSKEWYFAGVVWMSDD